MLQQYTTINKRDMQALARSKLKAMNELTPNDLILQQWKGDKLKNILNSIHNKHHSTPKQWSAPRLVRNFKGVAQWLQCATSRDE
jgi:hypothetical protein